MLPNRSDGAAGSGAVGLERVLERGILAGMLAAVPPGLLLMVVSAVQGRGLFTPAYRIATFVDADVLDTALRQAAAGDGLYFSREAFFFGVALNCFVGGGFGAGFAALAYALGLRTRVALVRAGLLYGLALLLIMGLVVLPPLGRLLELGRPVTDFAGAIGWPAFVAAHLLYGALLGRWSPSRGAAPPGEQAR